MAVGAALGRSWRAAKVCHKPVFIGTSPNGRREFAKTLTVFQGVKEQVRHLKTSILDRAEVCSQLPRESIAKIAPS